MDRDQVLYKRVTTEFETGPEGGLTLVLKTRFDKGVREGRKYFMTPEQLAELRSVAEGDFPENVRTLAGLLIRYEEGAERQELCALVDRSPWWISFLRKTVAVEGVQNGLINRNWLGNPGPRPKAAQKGRKGTKGASPNAIDQETGPTEPGSGGAS